MAKSVLLFVLLWVIIWAGMSTWRTWTKSAGFSIAKTIGLSGLAALMSSIILGLIVFLF